MPISREYEQTEPSREDIEATQGPVLVEFGAPWCGYCIAAQPHISTALARHPAVRHFKIEDGRGRPLGRSYRVKLWPTLIFLQDGLEKARVVRPNDATAIELALQQIGDGASDSG